MFQIVIIVIGLFAIIIKGMTLLSFPSIFDNAVAGGRIDIPDFNPDVYKRETFWTILFGSTILWGSPYARLFLQNKRMLT